jgi:hypothetical protein
MYTVHARGMRVRGVDGVIVWQNVDETARGLPCSFSSRRRFLVLLTVLLVVGGVRLSSGCP